MTIVLLFPTETLRSSLNLLIAFCCIGRGDAKPNLIRITTLLSSQELKEIHIIANNLFPNYIYKQNKTIKFLIKKGVEIYYKERGNNNEKNKNI